jgi:hypothetical protein
MRARNVLLVAVVFAAVFAAWVIGHPSAASAGQADTPAQTIRPFGT